MFANDASKELIKKLGKEYNDYLSTSLLFVKEVTKSKNKILSDKFLKLPDTNTLRVIFIIDALHQNPHLENPLDPSQIVDSLVDKKIPYHLLIDQYYQTIFTSVGNKNKPFDMSKVNFKMDEYGLNNDRQKTMFYLRCMDACGSQIYGFMNIVNPPNTEKALDYIEKFPQFDGLKYYQYTDLHFGDFQLEIFNDKGLQSYKSHFINELFKTLLNHAVCLNKEGDKQDVQDFFISSPLKDETLWKYTELQEVLKSIFKEE
ncbi:MAG: hypothetical protein COA38_17260 [Fluviicola sp.]|nr:MAG: hypothetical protein COA38_17260 [Fluviicola sp.]